MVPRIPSRLPALTGLVASFVLTSWIGASSARAQSPWFPLEVGRGMVYENDRFGTRMTIQVVGEDGDDFIVRFGSTEVLLRESGRAIELLVDGEFGLFYDFEVERFVHRDHFDCDDERELTVIDRSLVVDTPAGVFTDCIALEYGPGRCADAGKVSEAWAPDVGLVQWREVGFVGISTWSLVEIIDEPPPPPTLRRGDSNDDARVDLADAVFTLNWLFLGGPSPGCLDAADFGDDGLIRIDDPIATLTWLFSEGEPPPPPGVEDCGADPTEDDLSCDASDQCPI